MSTYCYKRYFDMQASRWEQLPDLLTFGWLPKRRYIAPIDRSLLLAAVQPLALWVIHSCDLVQLVSATSAASFGSSASADPFTDSPKKVISFQIVVNALWKGSITLYHLAVIIYITKLNQSWKLLPNKIITQLLEHGKINNMSYFSFSML